MLALTWLSYVAFGLTVGSIPPLVEPIIDDLGMTSGQMGLVLGAWQLVYIATASPLGAMVDRLGPRRSIAIGTGIILLSLILRGLAVDFWTLFLAVALFGAGGPIVSIGAPKVVAQWFHGDERGLAAGIYGTGPIVGMSIALATGASVVLPLAGSWRGISIAYGMPVLVIGVLWWLLARDAQVPPRPRGVPQPKGPSVLLELLRIRNVQIVLGLAVAAFLLNHGLNNWLATLLQEGGMSLARAGMWVSGGTMAGVVGLLVIPRLARRGRRVVTLMAMLAIAALTTLALASFSGPAQVSAVLVSGMVRSPMMPLLTLVLMETPGVGARRMGASAGLFFAAAEIGGFSGPLLMGTLRDLTGDLTTGAVVLAGVIGASMLALPFVKEGPSAEESGE